MAKNPPKKEGEEILNKKKKIQNEEPKLFQKHEYSTTFAEGSEYNSPEQENSKQNNKSLDILPSSHFNIKKNSFVIVKQNDLVN